MTRKAAVSYFNDIAAFIISPRPLSAHFFRFILLSFPFLKLSLALLAFNALKSKFNGGGRTVGYVIDSDRHFQIDPVTAPVILETFKRYDKGATIAELVRWHRDQAFRSGSGKPMRIDCVQQLLKNRRYIGEYRYREVVQPDGIPAIIPLELFERVQARMEKNKKAGKPDNSRDQDLLCSKVSGSCFLEMAVVVASASIFSTSSRVDVLSRRFSFF